MMEEDVNTLWQKLKLTEEEGYGVDLDKLIDQVLEK